MGSLTAYLATIDRKAHHPNRVVHKNSTKSLEVRESWINPGDPNLMVKERISPFLKCGVCFVNMHKMRVTIRMRRSPLRLTITLKTVLLQMEFFSYRCVAYIAPLVGNQRIFPIPFDPSVTIHGKTFTANKSGSQTPIFQTDSEEDLEYYTNIANGDDLILFLLKIQPPLSLRIIWTGLKLGSLTDYNKVKKEESIPKWSAKLVSRPKGTLALIRGL